MEAEMSWVEVDGAVWGLNRLGGGRWSWVELRGGRWSGLELGARFSNTHLI